MDARIDRFRLRHQHEFQQLFHDFSLDRNYRLFFIIVEGLIFYSSATVVRIHTGHVSIVLCILFISLQSEYLAALTLERAKFLYSLPDYVRWRSSQLGYLLAWLTQSTLPAYSYVHTVDQNNTGILFQLLPKVLYTYDTVSACKSIVMADEYAKHDLSPEELRFLDYAMLTKAASSSRVSATPLHLSKLASLSEDSLEIYHSLPIIYPYDNGMDARRALVDAIG